MPDGWYQMDLVDGVAIAPSEPGIGIA